MWHDLLEPDVLALVLIFGLPIVAVSLHYVYKIFKMRAETELKCTMVRQGMSADEIERVLVAGKEKTSRYQKGNL